MRVKSGFTLLEIVIAVIIIGILAFLIGSHYMFLSEKARLSEAGIVLDIVRKAQLKYYAAKSNYANNLDDLDFVIKPPRFFNDPIPLDATVFTGKVGYIQRNNLQNGAFGQYVLGVNKDGDITCVGIPGVCDKLGLDPW